MINFLCQAPKNQHNFGATSYENTVVTVHMINIIINWGTLSLLKQKEANLEFLSSKFALFLNGIVEFQRTLKFVHTEQVLLFYKQIWINGYELYGNHQIYSLPRIK